MNLPKEEKEKILNNIIKDISRNVYSFSIQLKVATEIKDTTNLGAIKKELDKSTMMLSAYEEEQRILTGVLGATK